MNQVNLESMERMVIPDLQEIQVLGEILVYRELVESQVHLAHQGSKEILVCQVSKEIEGPPDQVVHRDHQEIKVCQVQKGQ